MIKKKQYINAWTNIVAIMMFFLTFFTSYFVGGMDIMTSFLRAIITLIVSTIIAKLLIYLWNMSMPADDWRLLVKGPPEIPKRSETFMPEKQAEPVIEPA